ARNPAVHRRRTRPRHRLRLLREAVPDRAGAPARSPGDALMRVLAPVPDAAIDPATGQPRFGSYRGGLPRVDLGPVAGGTLRTIARRKRWLYFMMVSDDLLIALAVIRLGYASNVFAYAFDRRTLRMRATRSAIGPNFASEVGDTGGEGCVARFRLG